jgi:hypothetical protein
MYGPVGNDGLFDVLGDQADEGFGGEFLPFT